MAGSSNDEINSYSPKSKHMMKRIARLEELGEGLEVVRVNTVSVHTKVEALNKKNEKFSSSIYKSIERSLKEIEDRGGERMNHTKKETWGRASEERRYFESPHKDEREVPRKAPIDALKCRIPPFIRDEDVESYLDWEMKVDQVLACFDYLDPKKVKMVTYEFTGRRRHADTSANLKRELRSHFVLASYAKDLYNRLQCMYQGSKNIE
ncbi:hypothetical protein CR513_29486, partial [Mucuna pruriens]